MAKTCKKSLQRSFGRKKEKKKKTENMGEINTKACLKKKTETKRTGKIWWPKKSAFVKTLLFVMYCKKDE